MRITLVPGRCSLLSLLPASRMALVASIAVMRVDAAILASCASNQMPFSAWSRRIIGPQLAHIPQATDDNWRQRG
jgi:hypothetical protein